jgi:hypothetical protein
MRALRSSLTLGVILTAAAAMIAAQGANPRIGTWHLNVAKSKYDPGPAPKSQTLTIEAAGDGEKVTSEIVSASGATTTATYTAAYDGKPHTLTGSEIADTVTLKRIDANTSERVDSKGGKTVQTYTRTVSKDGKTMTVTIKGTNAQGKPVHNVAVFEKH